MNKAFLREPDADVRVMCPRCATPGTPVDSGPLDNHIMPQHRDRLPNHAWYCSQISCDVAYFSNVGHLVILDELRSAVYPYDIDAPICACFGFGYDEVEADVLAAKPERIRNLLLRSQSAEARCSTLAIDGQCCIKEIQRLYLKLR